MRTLFARLGTTALALAIGLSVTSAETFAAKGGGVGRREDALFGGIHRGSALQIDVGYPWTPRVSYLAGTSDTFAVGGSIGLLLSPYSFAGTAVGMQFGAPMRIAFANSSFTAGLRLDPAFYMYFAGLFGIAVGADANFGARIGEMVVLGGGISIPLSLVFGGGATILNIPILFGPVLEIQPSEMVSILVDLKFGPNIFTGSAGGVGGGGTVFGTRLQTGVALHF